MLHLVLIPLITDPVVFWVFAPICVYLYCIFIPPDKIFICYLYYSDLSTVVSFLSIVFANSDLGLMVFMLANWVFGWVGFLFLPLGILFRVLVFL